MNIAVLGSTGMAGHVVARYLGQCGHDVYRASRSEHNSRHSAILDVADVGALESWLNGIVPNAVVNCIGLLQKACDVRPDLAVFINSYIPHWLEEKYRNTATKVIHLSTDCVFSGMRGGYREDDVTDGMTLYDRSKALGELRNAKDLTFRMSIIGPDIDPAGLGLLNWFLQQTGDIQGYSGAIWNGVTTIELAKAIQSALEQNLTGLYHLTQLEPIDKCSLLEMAKRIFNRKGINIRPVDGVVLDKSLLNTRDDFNFIVRSYADQLEDVRSWIYSHKEEYTHYFTESFNVNV